MNKLLKCSVGVIVYNEAANIGKLLEALITQKTELTEIEEIIVVSSACTDRTDEIVQQYAEKESKIKLITEKERGGKSSAINKFIKAARTDLLIIESGDTIPAEDTVEKLIRPFQDSRIGITGGRPSPENDPRSFIGYSVCLLWNLHHQMALIFPKLGEMVAFRKIFRAIPSESAVDEASIEAIMKQEGFLIKYIPDAIVYNKGPDNLPDFVKQRRRIQAGHLWLKKNNDYSVASQDKGLLLKIAIEEFKKDKKKIFFLFGTAIVEMFSRFLGWYDCKILKKNPFKWDIANSTKNLEKEVVK
ncbi:MAG: glycosyltransferase [Candidatus Cloacimonetes bacterium]|nr:glycosyltransferase [Candidatus Cloacimonadota bacterium]